MVEFEISSSCIVAVEAKSLDAALRHALSTASLKEAARTVAMELGLPKREVYQRALAISKQQ